MIQKETELEKVKFDSKALETSMKSDWFVQGGAARYAKLPKLPNFDHNKDCIDAYLQKFERFAEDTKWERETWSINLSALLTRSALEVYSPLSRFRL